MYVKGFIDLKTYIFFMIPSVLLLIFIIAIHELGHYLFLVVINKREKVKVGLNKKGMFVRTDSDLTIFQKIGLRLSGVYLGLIFFLFHPDLLLLIFYLIGCRRDILETTQLIKELIR